jgi:hypothetical protein
MRNCHVHLNLALIIYAEGYTINELVIYRRQIFGENACHPEPMRFAQGKLREGSGSTGAEILRFAQDDSHDPSPVRFREAFFPNICTSATLLAASA